MTLPGIGDHDLGWAAYPLTILWIAFLANLVNLIDGMDSLAAGIVAIAAAAFAILSASFGRVDAAVLSAIVCGATVAFLYHNYHPAKIFMGDSGALALGFLLATLAVDGVLKTAAAITLVAPLLVLAVPILDTSFVVLKRLKYRRPPWRADHNHFYHRFMRIGFSQRRTAAYLHLWAMMMAGYALLARFVPPRPRGNWDLEHSLLLTGVGLLVIGASVWMVYSLEILKNRHLQAVGLRRFGSEAAAEQVEGDAGRGRRARARGQGLLALARTRRDLRLRPPAHGDGVRRDAAVVALAALLDDAARVGARDHVVVARAWRRSARAARPSCARWCRRRRAGRGPSAGGCPGRARRRARASSGSASGRSGACRRWRSRSAPAAGPARWRRWARRPTRR